MEMMFNGDDLSSTAAHLLRSAEQQPDNAEALLDLSTILLLRGDRDVGLSLQRQALSIKQAFHVQKGRGLRLLILKTPGDFMTNSPIEFLIRAPDIDAEVMFIAPDLPYPTEIDHDLVFNGISEGKDNQTALQLAATLIRQWRKPYVNRAEEIPLLSRDRACEILDALPGTYMPQNIILERSEVERMAVASKQISEFLVQDRFPILLRPVDSHAGEGLKKLASGDEIRAYLDEEAADLFYVAPFVDYRSSDGWFRKYRIAFVAGQPSLCHMAISDHWMIHYLNAGMTDSEWKRSEEADNMLHFSSKFGLRHEDALTAVGSAFDLEYFAIDCGETQDGQLLIFEAGNAMVVHDMDPVEMFPYKSPKMRELFKDFQSMLRDHSKLQHDV
jgi:glutathione synthase/RimK-type ligase-like ATP-grasp enzyme